MTIHFIILSENRKHAALVIMRLVSNFLTFDTDCAPEV